MPDFTFDERDIPEENEIPLEAGVTYKEYPVSQMNIEQLKQELYKLDDREPEIKAYYARKHEVLKTLKSLVGCGAEWDEDGLPFGEFIHWMDDKGRVWITVKKEGTFIKFQDFDVERTRDLSKGEKAGLSLTKARKLGYVVEGK
jgi:hypothetical protein